MTVRPVVRLPDVRLTRPSRAVGSVDDSVRELCTDLVDTMVASPACVGLAANQVGDDRRVFVVDVTGHRKARSCSGLIVLVDPEVLELSGGELAREGCMSVPDLTGEVVRADRVVVRGFTAEGEERVVESDAFEARAVLHEVDHLDGLLFLDRVASPTSVFRRRVYR